MDSGKFELSDSDSSGESFTKIYFSQRSKFTTEANPQSDPVESQNALAENRQEEPDTPFVLNIEPPLPLLAK